MFGTSKKKGRGSEITRLPGLWQHYGEIEVLVNHVTNTWKTDFQKGVASSNYDHNNKQKKTKESREKAHRNDNEQI